MTIYAILEKQEVVTSSSDCAKTVLMFDQKQGQKKTNVLRR